MAITIKRLRKLQVGQETTYGTGVAATAALICDDFAVDYNPQIYQPQQDVGLIALREPGVEVQRNIGWKASGGVTYQQILYWLNNAMVKVTTGTGVGADKLWTFTPATDASNDINFMTMETRHSDGTNFIDRQYPGCAATDLTISGALGGGLMFECNGFAKNEVSQAITGAISLPTQANFTIIGSNSLKIFMDATFAGLGTTQITGQFTAFSWKYMTGFSPAFYMDGATTLTRRRRNVRGVELTLTLDQEASSGKGEVFRAALASRALSYIEIRATGAALGSTNYLIKLQGAYTVSKVSPPADHEGEDALTVTLSALIDSTASQDVKALVTTAAATLT